MSTSPASPALNWAPERDLQNIRDGAQALQSELHKRVYEPSFESVLASKPDLVTVQFEYFVGPEGVVGRNQQFEELGIPVYTSPSDCVGKDNKGGGDGVRHSVFDMELIYREIEELARIHDVQDKGAQVIAEYLESHPKVKRTIYPGLKSHPHHGLARKQMRGFGGLISFDVGSLENAKTVLNRLRLMALAESLGGVETLISHPAIMTHASVPKERREMLGITDGLIRISVGIEDVEDLQADLEQALSAV